MALIIIPTRIIPGCLLGGLFAGIGMFNAIGASILISQHRFIPISLLGLPFLGFAIWLIINVWQQGGTVQSVTRATRVSPRLLAIILGVCLLVGLVTGSMAGPLMTP